MRYDRPTIKEVMNEINYVFKDDISLLSCNEAPERGWYKIEIKHIVTGYTIIFECEYSSLFSIIIKDKDRSISLCQIVDFNSNYTLNNILDALIKLKNTLDKKIYFYRSIGKHLYKETADNGLVKIMWLIFED